MVNRIIKFLVLLMMVLTIPMVQASPYFTEESYSYANTHEIHLRHASLDIKVDFNHRMLVGSVTYQIDPTNAKHMILDTQNLKILRASTSQNGKVFRRVAFHLGNTHSIKGTPLTISLPSNARYVKIKYVTNPNALGLQWSNKFMFTDGEAIRTRSWLPTQDTPKIRISYDAKLHTPKRLMAVMSAAGNPHALQNGVYRFHMPEPIPPYLIAFAVGDLRFKSLGENTGVYAQPHMIDKAAKEFEEVNAMMVAAEKLYGPYRWGRYDILVLPEHYPFGGMENPRLTFTAPSVVAGDKSLVYVIAHELAHSWSGNLVTNASWNNVWLNEGLTTYVENRIIEAVYGDSRATMERVLQRHRLDKAIVKKAVDDQRLHQPLNGRRPSTYAFTEIPYLKGSLFLQTLESYFGRHAFDRFLKQYIEHFAFKSLTTKDFENFVKMTLYAKYPKKAKTFNLEEWLYEPGVPANAPKLSSTALIQVERQLQLWVSGEIDAAGLQTDNWNSKQFLYFLVHTPDKITANKMADLDKRFHFTDNHNISIAFRWLELAIFNNYKPAHGQLKKFFMSTGNKYYLNKLYKALLQSPHGKPLAKQIYKQARVNYSPIVIKELDPAILT